MLRSTNKPLSQLDQPSTMAGKLSRKPLRINVYQEHEKNVSYRQRQEVPHTTLSKIKNGTRIPTRTPKCLTENAVNIRKNKPVRRKSSKKSLSSLSPIKEKNEQPTEVHEGKENLAEQVDLADIVTVEECCDDVKQSLQINDPFLCPEYFCGVYQYLQSIENQFCPPCDYLEDDNAPCTSVNRAVLLDWLIQVQCHLELMDVTLFLTMNLVDRFLQVSSVSLDKLQLLGITCLFIASKIEERYPPEVTKLCFLTAHSYSCHDVLRMERIILLKLKFELSIPSSVYFYDLMTSITSNMDRKVELIGRYLMDLSLCTTDILRFAPSLRAAAALYFSRQIYDGEDCPAWTSTLSTFTGYNEVDMIPCVEIYAQLLLKAPIASQQAARNKYSSRSRYDALSQQPLLTESPVLIAFKAQLSHLSI